MKIAYLLLVHSNPLLLKRTIAALSSERCAFFVHVDAKSDARAFASTGGENVFILRERLPVYWGEFSQVDATLLLLRQALAAPEGYERFVFVQGSTYPIRSGRYIQRFLAANADAEFINATRMPAPGYPLSKINTIRYPSDEPVRRTVTKALAKAGLAQRDYRQHLRGLEPYAGHACWALSRAACQHLVDASVSHPFLADYLRNTFAPDESYFHTIFGNSPFRARARKAFFYADWSTSKGDHPLMVNERHLSLFEANEKLWIEDEWGAGEMLFARKFSDARLDLVDRVDEIVRRKDFATERVVCGA